MELLVASAGCYENRERSCTMTLFRALLLVHRGIGVARTVAESFRQYETNSDPETAVDPFSYGSVQ